MVLFSCPAEWGEFSQVPTKDFLPTALEDLQIRLSCSFISILYLVFHIALGFGFGGNAFQSDLYVGDGYHLKSSNLLALYL